MGDIRMSEQELLRVEVLLKYRNRGNSYQQIADILQLSRRQVIRLSKRLAKEGPKGIGHRNRGKTSNNKIPKKTRDKILSIITPETILKTYENFGPTLLQQEVLGKRENIHVSREWLRKFLIEHGLWQAKKPKEIRIYQRRPRRLQEGELEQIDGSYHAWFEDRGPKCCLLVIIDDATSKIQELRFVEHEDRDGYFGLMKKYIKRRGIPRAIYSDRHSIFKTTRHGYELLKDTQFTGAMKALGIEAIFANSPQAKGRVERANRTLQDRLIKMMRLEGISNIEEGNRYLDKFREEYNAQFSRQAYDPCDGHKTLGSGVNLEYILCSKEERKISKNHTVFFKNKTYQLKMTDRTRALRGSIVRVYESPEGVKIELGGKFYEYTIYEEQPYNHMIMDRKYIDAFLDRKTPLTGIQRYRRGVRNF
jgi:transposase